MWPLRFLVGGGRFSARSPIGGSSNGHASAGAAAASVSLAGGSMLFCFRKDSDREKKKRVAAAAATDLGLTDEERVKRVTVLVTDDEDAMRRRRFKEWKAEYMRQYRNKQEEAWRYELFKASAIRADELNAMSGGRGSAVFGDYVVAELPCSGCHQHPVYGDGDDRLENP